MQDYKTDLKQAMKENLNIVFIGSPTFPIGRAMSKRWRYLVDYMNSQNMISHVLITRHNDPVSYQNPSQGNYGLCEYVDISNLCSINTYGKYVNKGKRLLKQWYVNEKKNILVTTGDAELFTYPFLVYAKQLGYSIILDVVETNRKYEENQAIKRNIHVRIMNFLTHRVRKFSSSFVISSNLEIELRNNYPSMKICILPNSTPIYVECGKKRFASPLKVLYAGTYASKDGISYLIDGVIEAYNKGVNLRLILVGQGTDRNMEILEKTKGLNYIDYRGFVSDDELIQTMKNCDVLCMTRTNSRFANFGFPFKLSEYLATGNVVLATKVGDIPKYITHKYDAYLIEPEDRQSISETLIHISNNPDEALTIASNGLETARRKFGVENIGRKFLGFLEII